MIPAPSLEVPKMCLIGWGNELVGAGVENDSLGTRGGEEIDQKAHGTQLWGCGTRVMAQTLDNHVDVAAELVHFGNDGAGLGSVQEINLGFQVQNLD